MTIMRIEGVTFGVTNLSVCSQFLSDMGLQQQEPSDDGDVTFRTPANQQIRLVPSDSKALPAVLQAGSTVREVMWGVDNEEALAAIAASLANDLDVKRDNAGALHAVDPIGFGIAFAVSHPHDLSIVPRVYNVDKAVTRQNRGVETADRPTPLRLIHVALDLTRAAAAEARAFYMKRLKFRAIDDVDGVGVFLQCEGDDQHHNLFLCHRPNRTGINHLAFEVPDFDNVIRGGEYMAAQGWKESRRLGRHLMGSNIFRFFHSPCGGRIEFAADMDRMDRDFQPRHWTTHPGHHIWMMKPPVGSLDAD
jgi:catechol 2,3-dioxygenase-like lactoylglutathione lyase family enzyme